ncbi:MAG TPA: tetratricopeptide repeat protein, partial [Spirochaetales bacterium]|nr:tetratricopeptide repeat protein [Spirochaetales bacterium]
MRRGRGAERPAALVPLLLSILLSCLSCAGAPAAPAAPASSPQPGSEPGAAGGGTALKGAAPQALSRALEERRAVEAAVVFGSPSSIAKAFSLIAEATSLKEEEAFSLAWMGARIALLVYPESADSFVPADLRGQAELPASPLARSLADAAAGRVPALLPEAEGTPLGELVPALAAFRSDSRETARRCLEALDRFERLGAPSVLPGLVRGLDAERRKDFARALDYYAGVRSAAPDAWPASLGAARAYLALGRPAAAEELLRQVDPAAADSPPIRRVRARALYDLGRLSEAEPLVLRILLEDPQDSAFVLVRAHLLARSRSFQQAQPLLDAYGTVDPSNRRYLALRAEVAEGLRGRDEALKWARRGLAAYPDDPELLAVAARLLFAVPSTLRADLVEAARSEGRELARRAEGQA